jgi:hypothetical protein
MRVSHFTCATPYQPGITSRGIRVPPARERHSSRKPAGCRGLTRPGRKGFDREGKGKVRCPLAATNEAVMAVGRRESPRLWPASNCRGFGSASAATAHWCLRRSQLQFASDGPVHLMECPVTVADPKIGTPPIQDRIQLLDHHADLPVRRKRSHYLTDSLTDVATRPFTPVRRFRGASPHRLLSYAKERSVAGSFADGTPKKLSSELTAR